MPNKSPGVTLQAYLDALRNVHDVLNTLETHETPKQPTAALGGPKLLPTGSSSVGEGQKLLLPWAPGVHQHQKLSCTHVPFRLHMCRGMDCVRAHHTTGSMQLHPPHSKPVASASPMRATAHQWVQVKGHRQCCDHVPAQTLHIDPADFGPLRTSHLHTHTQTACRHVATHARSCRTSSCEAPWADASQHWRHSIKAAHE